MRALVLRLSLILIFIIPWEGMIELSQIGTLARLFGIGLAAMWLIMVFVTGQVRKLSSYHVAVAVFVLWNLLSVFWSDDPRTTFDRADSWVQLFGLTLIFWDLYRTREVIARGLQAYVLGAYVALGGALYNFATGDAYYTRFQRFAPGDQNPDGFGFVIAIGLPIAWYLVSQDQVAISDSPRLNRLFRLANYAFIPAGFVGIALSGTRTAAIAAGVGMLYGLSQLIRLNPRRRVLAFLGLTAVFLVLVPVIAPLRSFQRLGTTTNELTEGDLNGRLGNWSEGLNAFNERPIIGFGSNMYRTVNVDGKVAHNSFLSVLVELGVIGFMLFLIVLLFVFRAIVIQPKWRRWFWLTMLTVWGIGASTLTWEHRKTTWLIFTLAVASAAVIRTREEPKEPVPAEIVPW
jgi:O-antigen ligase